MWICFLTAWAAPSEHTVEAVGRHEIVVDLPTFGRYAFEVRSEVGTALTVVDRMEGPSRQMGRVGERDGRLDGFFDVGEATGTVEQVTLRTTRLRDVNGTVWHVPNGQILRVGNKSQQWARAVVDVQVDPKADLEKAVKAIVGWDPDRDDNEAFSTLAGSSEAASSCFRAAPTPC